MKVGPNDVVFTLTRVALRPEYRQMSDESDSLTGKLVSACKTKLRYVQDQLALLGDVCGRFRGCRRWAGLRNGEVESISRAAGEGLSIVSPPRLLIESYGFGLSSYRVIATVRVLSHDQDEMLRSWRGMASEFRRILEDRMREFLMRGSMASQYFSEIYSFYELDMSLPEIVARWSELESSLIPDPESRKFFISPLKTSSPPPEPEPSFLPNPVYISRDGIFSFFHYDFKGEGKRRNVHLMRRKRRRLFRLAIDLSLGLKVFLENEDLWLMGTGNLWGAMVGMVYLSPRVVVNLMRGAGRRFIDFYSSLNRSMDLIEKFESYEDLFTFSFPTEKHMLTFVHVVRLLGGTPPRNMIQLPLTDLQLALLKILLMKDGLDAWVEEWEGGSLGCLAKFLCEYSKLLLSVGRGELSYHGEDYTDLVERAVQQVTKGEPTGGCAKELFDHLSSRRGRRKGLTVRELSILLGAAPSLDLENPYYVVNSNLNALEREKVITVDEGRRGRVRKSGKRTKRGLPVRVYYPNHEHMMVSYMERLMEGAIQRAHRGMVEKSCF